MASFFYAQGDAAKTPVDVVAQPLNAKLIFVTESGREVPFRAGKRVTNDPAAITAKLAADRAGTPNEG